MNKEQLNLLNEWLDQHTHRDTVSMDKGLQDFKTELPDQKPLIQRIITAYQRAKEDESKYPQFMSNEMWTKDIQKTRGYLIDALSRGSVSDVEEYMRNFWRTSLSHHLVKYPRFEDMQADPDLKSLFETYVALDINRVATYLPDWVKVETLAIPCIGNPFGGMVRGTLVTGASIHTYYYAQKVMALLKSSYSSNVVEIGGGIGILAYYLLRDSFYLPYHNYDIPEILAINQYYLLNALPNISFNLYGEDSSISYVGLLPSFAWNLRGADIVINFHSLSEMRKETVEAYLGELKCEYFYHENSFIKQEYNETPVSEFPIDRNKYVMVYNSNSIFGEPIYREYLWRRRI